MTSEIRNIGGAPHSVLTPEQIANINRNKERALQIRQQKQRSAAAAAAFNCNTVATTSKCSITNNVPASLPKTSYFDKEPSSSFAISHYFSNKASQSGTQSKSIVDVKCSLITVDRFEVSAPYDDELLTVFKNISTRNYDGEKKTNNFHLSSYPELCANLQKNVDLWTRVNFFPLPDWILGAFRSWRKLQQSEIELRPRLSAQLLDTLHAYQVEGIKWVVSRGGRALIADAMGLGKTAQALALCQYYKHEWPVLVVVQSSVVGVWKKEVVQWLGSEVKFLQLKTVDHVLSLRDQVQAQNTLACITYDMMSKHLQLLITQRFQVLVMDESHLIKDAKSQRTKAALQLSKNCNRVMCLSGTPANNKPADLFTQLKCVGPKWMGKMSFKAFADRYCDGHQGAYAYEANGCTNPEELNVLLLTTVMLKRNKDNVALPPKHRHMQMMDKDSIRHKYKLAFQFKDQSKQMDTGDSRASANVDNSVLLMYEPTAQAKTDAVAEFVLDLLHKDNQHKMLLFAHHACMMDALDHALTHNGLDLMRIDGTTTSDQRGQLVHKFQTDDRCRVALLSVVAASTGLTLTAANLVVFAELSWTPAILMQAEERAHRMGQQRPVDVYYLVAKGTADDQMWDIIDRKLLILAPSAMADQHLQQMNSTTNVGDTQQATYRLDEFYAPVMSEQTKQPCTLQEEPFDPDTAAFLSADFDDLLNDDTLEPQVKRAKTDG